MPAGINDEFEKTLDMQDETVGHEARMGEDHRKYDGLGLNGADAAVIESTRSAKKIDGPKDSEAGDAVITDTAKLLTLGVPSQESAVDETRAANAAAVQRAADAQKPSPSGVNAQNAPVTTPPKQQDAVTAEELPKSRYASSKPEAENTTSNASQRKTALR